MNLSQIPAKFMEIWAKNAPGTLIRAIPLTTTTFGQASLDKGWPVETQTPIAAGGVPPDIRDFNGAFQMLSAWNQWQAAGGCFPPYDSAFSASIGGYPAGAVVQSATTFGQLWVSQVDNNTTNPDAAGAGWVLGSMFGFASTGDVKLSYKTAADFGWVMMNDGSIGDASSGATTLAAASTAALFTLMYNNMTDTWAPIQTSTGAATTRAAQGAASVAYGAHCRLVLPLALGRAIAASGGGAGLTARALGQNLGEEAHLQTVAELPAHAHTVNDPTHSHNYTPSPNIAGGGSGGFGAVAGGSAATTNSATGITLQNTGGSTPFNVMQPSSFMNAMVKL